MRKTALVLSFVILCLLLVKTSTSFAENKKVLAVDTHHVQVGGRYDKLINYAKGKGWEIIKLDIEPITFKLLKNKDISILCSNFITLPYTEDEIEVIRKFVENGGGLFLAGDHPGFYNKELARVFGITITNEGPRRDVNMAVSSKHPLMKDVDIFSAISRHGRLTGARYLKVNPPSYVVLEGGVTSPYRPIIAAAEYGKGRVVIVPSLFILRLNSGDNSYFLRNALYWLQQ